jgi:hypothetical protein
MTKVRMDNPSNDYYFEPWTLGSDLEQAYEQDETVRYQNVNVPVTRLLNQLTGSELKQFRKQGGGAEFRDEKLYESDIVNYFGLARWYTLLATHEGELYKIGLTYILDEYDNGLTTVKIANSLQKLYGKSINEDNNVNKLHYRSANVHVILMTKFIQGSKAFGYNIIVRLA